MKSSSALKHRPGNKALVNGHSDEISPVNSSNFVKKEKKRKFLSTQPSLEVTEDINDAEVSFQDISQKKARKKQKSENSYQEMIPSASAGASSNVDPSNSPDRKILLIHSLPLEITKETLFDYLSEIGTPSQCFLFPSHLPSITAIVQFPNDLPDSALEYDGATIEKKKVRIRFATSSDKRILVSRLLEEVDGKILKKYFKEAGTVISAEKRGQFEGLVTFDSYESVAKILAYDGADIHGKSCHICFYPEQSTGNNKNNNHNQNKRNKITMKTLKTAQDVDLVADEDINQGEEDSEMPKKMHGMSSTKLNPHSQPKAQQEKLQNLHRHNGKPQKYIKSQ